jgi:hypothetical protein
MLTVCELVPERKLDMASGDRSWLDIDPARDIDIMDASEFVLSMIVGLRERIPLGEPSSAPPYMLVVLPWDSPRSFISFKYAMMERKARVYASRARSSSLREAKSMWSPTRIGLGVGLRLSSSESSLGGTDRRSKAGTGVAGRVNDTSPTGKKLLLLDARGTGEGEGTRKLAGVVTGGIGDAFSEFGFSCPCSGVDKATEGTLVVSGPKNPVVEKRTSIWGDVSENMERLEAGAETGWGWGVRLYEVCGRDGTGDSGPGLIFPIDIFFKKPHRPFFSLSLEWDWDCLAELFLSTWPTVDRLGSRERGRLGEVVGEIVSTTEARAESGTVGSVTSGGASNRAGGTARRGLRGGVKVEEKPRLAYRWGTIGRPESGELPATVSRFELDAEVGYFGNAGRGGVARGKSCVENWESGLLKDERSSPALFILRKSWSV